MLLLDHLNRLSNVLCNENVLQVIKEICGIEAKLAVEDFLVLVDILYFYHFPHKIVTIIDHLSL